MANPYTGALYQKRKEATPIQPIANPNSSPINEETTLTDQMGNMVVERGMGKGLDFAGETLKPYAKEAMQTGAEGVKSGWSALTGALAPEAASTAATNAMAAGVDAGIANAMTGAAGTATANALGAGAGTMGGALGSTAAGAAGGAAAGGLGAAALAAAPWLLGGLALGKAFGLFNSGGFVGPLAGAAIKEAEKGNLPPMGALGLATKLFK